MNALRGDMERSLVVAEWRLELLAPKSAFFGESCEFIADDVQLRADGRGAASEQTAGASQQLTTQVEVLAAALCGVTLQAILEMRRGPRGLGC